MTIGPAPMIRIDLRSLRFGIAHQSRKAVEQIPNVVRARACLRMTLEAERRPVGARKPLEGTVEERDMRGAQVRSDGGGVDREAVVLARDDDLARVEVLHRMVGAVVAEFHLERLRAGG